MRASGVYERGKGEALHPLWCFGHESRSYSHVKGREGDGSKKERGEGGDAVVQGLIQRSMRKERKGVWVGVCFEKQEPRNERWRLTS